MKQTTIRFFLLLTLLLPLAALGAAGSAPSWPSLHDQLQADAVTPHSALEALIAANQDFSVLRPDEAKDKIPVPLWLRVIWRRAHPEAVYSAQDPTGGYPFVLKEVHEWMLTHQSLVPGPADKDTQDLDADELPTKTAGVSGEKRISGAQTAPRSESDIRVNYWDPMKIIGASNNISGSGSQAQFFSTDGGVTWGQSSLPLQPGDAFHSDPTVDWTSDGTAWSTTIGINSGGSVLHMRSYKSVDNGATWTFDATFSGAQTSTDKQIIWVDHSATSPFKDNLYAIWHNGLPAFMNRRTGPAGSWQTAIQVSGAESTGTAIGDDVKTNSFGDVFGFWPTTGNQKIFVVKSTNGGVSYGTPVQIGTTFDSFDIGIPSMNSRRLLIYVSAGAYRTATKNLVYATWVDLSGAAGCTTPANEPGSNAASTCKSRVWFSRSTDGGATWSTAVKINDQASLNDQLNQWLVVDEATGALEVMYYDTVADPTRKKVDVWTQSSFDDGVTWSPAVKVTSAQTDETISGADSGNQFGDYNGMSGISGTFFPSWTDRRNAAREEIWTAKVFDPACTAPGPPAIGTATASAPNQIQVTWGNGSPASTTFNVYRAVGTCASHGTLTAVGTALAGSPFTDSSVSGSITYAYQVTGLEATGRCESVPSGCVQATATGACTLPPTFAGLVSVTNQAASVLRPDPVLGGGHAGLRRPHHLQGLPLDDHRLHSGAREPARQRRHRHELQRHVGLARERHDLFLRRAGGRQLERIGGRQHRPEELRAHRPGLDDPRRHLRGSRRLRHRGLDAHRHRGRQRLGAVHGAVADAHALLVLHQPPLDLRPRAGHSTGHPDGGLHAHLLAHLLVRERHVLLRRRHPGDLAQRHHLDGGPGRGLRGGRLHRHGQHRLLEPDRRQAGLVQRHDRTDDAGDGEPHLLRRHADPVPLARG